MGFAITGMVKISKMVTSESTNPQHPDSGVWLIR
jgi:hypothetical protein